MIHQGRRVFLTGGTGFVGSHAVAALARDPERSLALLVRPDSDTTRLDGVIGGNVRLIRGDLNDVAALRGPLAEFSPDTVVHLAWDGVGPKDRDETRQLRNIEASVALLDLVIELGTTAWIGAGSQAEYGPHHAAIRETDPTRPTTLYGASKLSVNHLARLRARAAGLRFVWLRIFSTYGPGDSTRWLIPYVAVALLRGERPALTEGRQLWDYLHVRDIARAVRAVVDDPDAEGAFNVGSGRVVTIRRVVERIRDLVDPSIPLRFGELLYRPDQVMHLEADIGRLTRATGWSPQIDLDEGLEETVTWYREHLDAFVD